MVLNCPPLDDLGVQTLARILVGETLTELPQPNDPAVNFDHLSRWEAVEAR